MAGVTEAEIARVRFERLDTRPVYAIDVRTSSVVRTQARMLYWLMSDEALQVRMIRAIREARTPLTAWAPGPVADSGAAPNPLTINGNVATIRVEGVLTPTPDMMAACYGEPNTTYAELRESLRAAAADPNVREIVWDIDSPGGAVDGLFALLDDIADARAAGANMRVEAENAHSAAYGIAAAVGSITARSRTASFGSVGVATTGFISGGMCGKAVDITDSDAPEKRPDIQDPEGRAVVVRYLDQIAAEFRGVIAQGRGVTPEHVAKNYGRGSSMLATAALSAGLIDAVAKRTPANARSLTNARTSGSVPDRMVSEATADLNIEVDVELPAELVDDAPAPAPVVVAVPAPPAPVLTDADAAELAALRADRDARLTAERRALITDLVALGAERPATAWVNGAPAPRLATEPIESLRERVAAFRSDHAPGAVALTPPTTPAAEFAGLSEGEARRAETIKDPAERSRFIQLCNDMRAKARGKS